MSETNSTVWNTYLCKVMDWMGEHVARMGEM